MLRACVLPSSEFAHIDISLVNECCAKFYEIFDNIFGETNCTYNLHVFVAHLLEIRTHGPLTDTSAFKFESFYGEMRRSFVPGTISPLKQIMKNIFMKRILRKHSCSKDIVITNYETALESNNMIYTYNKKKYEIYKICEINDTQIMCNKVGKYQASFPETPQIDWSTVGVFRKGGTISQLTTINKSEMCGKVLTVGKYLLTCPNNVLTET